MRFSRLFFPAFIAAFLLIGLYSCEDSATDPTDYTIFESYLVSPKGEPVENATIKAFEQAEKGPQLIESTTSDSAGKFRLEKLPLETSGVSLEISHADYITINQPLDSIREKTKNGGSLSLLESDTCCGRITVTIKDSASGEALNDAEVRLNKGDDILKKKYSGEDGIVVFEEVCEGEYWLRIALDGYYVQEPSVEITDCDSVNVEVNLVQKEEEEECCDNTVEIKINYPDGNPASAKVYLKQGEKVIEDPETEDGSVKFEELCKGAYMVLIVNENYKTIEFEFEVGCEDEKTFEKKFEEKDDCCGKLEIKAKDGETGEWLKGAEVKLIKGNDLIKKKYTNESGKVLFEELCPGNYWYRVAVDGYKVIEKEVKIEDCEPVTKIAEAEAIEQDTCCDGILKVIVRDSTNGEGIKGAKLRLWQNGDMKDYSYTNADGVAIIDGICEGEWAFDVIHEQYNDYEKAIDFNCNETKEYEIYLGKNDEEDCCGKAKIIVRDKVTEKVIKNAEVKITPKDGGESIRKETNGDGYAYFDGLCMGGYRLRIEADGYLVDESDITIEDCNGYQENYRLTPNEEDCCDNVAKVIVKDEDGNPIGGAKVRLWKNGDNVENLYTNESGKVIFDGLCKGGYGISIIKEGYAGKEFEFEVNCSDEKEFTKTLQQNEEECCDAKIFIKPVDSESEEIINGAKVRLWKGGDMIKQIIIDGEPAKFTGICEGNYWIDILAEGYNSIEFEITADCDNPVELVKSLEED